MILDLEKIKLSEFLVLLATDTACCNFVNKIVYESTRNKPKIKLVLNKYLIAE